MSESDDKRQWFSVTAGPEEFRAAIRGWLNAHQDVRLIDLPPDVRRTLKGQWIGAPNARTMPDACWEWESRLAEAGLICPQWPAEFGGLGLDSHRMMILNEEFSALRMPRVTRDQGEALVAPAVLTHGTPEQRIRLLSRIRSGEDRYCQGFSEPEAGSDLASVRTSGALEGDEVVVTGQKVWTSRVMYATHSFVLCRTDPAASKHRGLSFVLVPLEGNSVDPRPLRQMSGASEFFEVFYDGARAPLANVIGGLGAGWTVAMTVLGSERGGEATVQYLPFLEEFWRLVELARERGLLSDPIVRQRFAWAYAHVAVMRFAGQRSLAAMASDGVVGLESSINKLFWSEYHQEFANFALEVGGPAAQQLPVGTGYQVNDWQQMFFYSRAETIFSGTSQIQRNIIAERVLGLPR